VLSQQSEIIASSNLATTKSPTSTISTWLSTVLGDPGRAAGSGAFCGLVMAHRHTSSEVYPRDVGQAVCFGDIASGWQMRMTETDPLTDRH
jgi:hypothetical protein